MSGTVPKVYLLAPTFREPAPVARLLDALAAVDYPNWTLWLVNCQPGDATSELIRRSPLGTRIRELAGHSGLFWSGAQNVGLRALLAEASDQDLVVLLNVDIGFGPGLLTDLVDAHRAHPAAQIGALACAQGRVVSSGVRIRSWMWALTRHPYAGRRVGEVPATEEAIPVDLLPTRCVLFPVSAVRAAGLIQERWLPHYGADYEFTARLARSGYPALLCPRIRIESDVSNTGNDLYRKPMGLGARLRRLFDIKSPFNPVHRSAYVILTYPWWAVPSALAAYLGKTLLEVSLGGDRLRRLFRGTDRGFS